MENLICRIMQWQCMSPAVTHTDTLNKLTVIRNKKINILGKELH